MHADVEVNPQVYIVGKISHLEQELLWIRQTYLHYYITSFVSTLNLLYNSPIPSASLCEIILM